MKDGARYQCPRCFHICTPEEMGTDEVEVGPEGDYEDVGCDTICPKCEGWIAPDEWTEVSEDQDE